jgi:Na+/pantothenate symporter
MTYGLDGTLIISFISLAGFWFYWKLRVNREAPEVETYSTFFMGGEKIGRNLTMENNWGLCFAFANAVWYYAYLGFTYGPKAYLFQVPWSLSIVILGYFLPIYIKHSKHGTIHSFLSSRYGNKFGLYASIITTIGYFLNVGFEVYFSTFLISKFLGTSEYTLPLALTLSVFISLYLVVGGYKANAKTDPYQNWACVIALVALLWLMCAANGINPIDLLTALIPAASSSLNMSDFQPVTWDLILGITAFTFFFNFVDMANWQSVASNRLLENSDIKRVQTGFYSSAFRQMIAPAILGTLLGVIVHYIDKNTAQADYFDIAMKSVSFGSPMLTFVVVGLLVFGFISVTLSSADSYSLAALQTLSTDVIKRKDFLKSQDSNVDKGEREALERAVINWSKKFLLFLTPLMTLSFFGLYSAAKALDNESAVFNFQFAMYGAAMVLFPALVGAFMGANEDENRAKFDNRFALVSIIFGLSAVLIPFAAFQFFIAEDIFEGFGNGRIIPLTPVFGILVSGAIYGYGFWRWRRISAT